MQHAAIFHLIDGENGNLKGFVHNMPNTFGAIYRGVRKKGKSLTLDLCKRCYGKE